MDHDFLWQASGPLATSHFMTRYSSLWQLTQGRNSMAGVGPSTTITESRFMVIVISGTKHGCRWELIQGKSNWGHCHVIRDQVWPPLAANLRLRWSHRAKYNSRCKSTRGRSRIIWDQAWQSLMANSRSRWHLVFCVSFCRSHHFTFRRHVVPWELTHRFGFGAFNDRAARPLIIRVHNVSLHLNRDHWFEISKRSLIPAVDLVLKPPTIDLYWAKFNGLDLIILGLIKGETFPSFSLFTLRLSPNLFFLFRFSELSFLRASYPLNRCCGGSTAEQQRHHYLLEYSGVEKTPFDSFHPFRQLVRSLFHHLCPIFLPFSCCFFFERLNMPISECSIEGT